MSKTIKLHSRILIFGIPLFIIGLMVFISKTPLFIVNPKKLALGITFDLLLTVPIIYFLLIRKTSIPKTTIVPFLILGIVVCSLILPKENQYYLNLFKTWVFPIIELSILFYVIYNIRKGIQYYKRQKVFSIDLFTVLKNTCYEILPKNIVPFVVTEIAVFYYGFIFWKKRELKDNEFSYHKDSGTITLLIAIIFIIAIETVVFHILLNKWSNIVAWALTILSIYSAIQILGFLKSMTKRPISIINGKLHLRYGIMNETVIDIKNIDTIEINSKDIEFNKENRRLSILGELEGHNIIIHLKESNTLIGLYGIKRKFKSLAFYIDDKVKFKTQLSNILEENNN